MASKTPATPAAEPGGWFHNIGGHAVMILHELGTFVVDAGRAMHLPFAAEHRDLVQVTEDAAKVIETHAEADAKAAAEATAQVAEAEVHTAAETVAATTEPAPAPAVAAAETPKE